MGNIYIKICKMLYRIYDIYQKRGLNEAWRRYNNIIKAWISENEVVKEIKITVSSLFWLSDLIDTFKSFFSFEERRR
jgi:hypothetical protein